MTDMYRAIWRATGRQQLVLILLAVLVSALAAAPLKFQQLVVNGLVEQGSVQALALLCAGYLAAVLLSALLKALLNYRLSVLGERVVLMIRERLYRNHVADTVAGSPDLPKRGTLVTMLSSEAEALGAFAGSSIATPLVQIGTLASVLAFIAASQPSLGLLAAAVVVPQALVVVLIQRRINARVKERVQALRDVAARISDSALLEVEEPILIDFAEIFGTRRRLFVLKLSSKFVLTAISATGTVGILFLGGWLVLRGESDVGTVVASITGLARIEGPWRELIAFFRNASTIRVKYGMVADALRPRGDDTALTATELLRR